jgi:hypothetical protein
MAERHKDKLSIAYHKATFAKLEKRSGNLPQAKRLAKERMKCNQPRRDVQGGKKSVVKACENGQEKFIRFGDANMEIKRDNPERRKNFRARHNCDEKKSKLTAGYWSCKAW